VKNIPNPNKKNKIPGLEVSYSKPKTKHGIYYSYTKSMCIYVNTHTSLLELCDTILHEYKHHLDMPTQAHQKQYNTFTETVGYFDNPYEKAAREFALQHRDKCIQDLYHLGYLI
jgi:Zn-dependent peptidase ImmA (M78 family)